MYTVSLMHNYKESKRTFHELLAAKQYARKFWHLDPIISNDIGQLFPIEDYDNYFDSEF